MSALRTYDFATWAGLKDTLCFVTLHPIYMRVKQAFHLRTCLSCSINPRSVAILAQAGPPTLHQIHLRFTTTMSVPFDAIPHDVKQEVLGELEKEYMKLGFTDAVAVAKWVTFWEACRRIQVFECNDASLIQWAEGALVLYNPGSVASLQAWLGDDVTALCKSMFG